MPDLPLRMELTLHDCLIYQLDRVLNCCQFKASDLQDQPSQWMDKWSEQTRQRKELKEKLELFEALKEPRKEKLELPEALLEKLEALKQAMEDASGLCDIILEKRAMIDLLWSWVEEELKLRGKVQQLEQSLQYRQREVTGL